MTASLAQSVFHFVIREHSAEGRTPIDFTVRQIRQAEMHQNQCLLAGRHGLPIDRCEVPSEVLPEER